ncbi:pyridine nucleotide-disulfide oxidoreductase [Acrocarpospora corrugata]|uniref:Pyridine nucleotide-disulfide oxidoreductase n=1 Tax=Acrocarpospora corrugata TaxID=35763 RepID=A0A5M3W3U0_9ACTN|nr:FAD-dependent oxidoreductase [Acrocarpospora corrugata]GES01268.1 pyridine nucleotide-disulfide oxidoreductase [Acrocarpospora corrugata]
MSDVLIIGGGFAGVWSALGAARLADQRLTITLVAPGDDLVIRPRLYEAAPAALRVPLERILQPTGVTRLPAVVTAIDTDRRSVTVTRVDGQPADLSYRRLILASGSALRRPALPGHEHLFDVDTLPNAVALDSHLRTLPARPAGSGRFTAVVIGSGFTGLEVSTELAGRLRALAGPAAHEVRVVLVERAATLGPELGPGPRPVITAALDELGIEIHLNTSAASLDATRVLLTDGTEIPAHTAIWTAGMMASPLTRQIPGKRDHLDRLLVDKHLRAPEAPEVFVAGDTAAASADDSHLTLQSCQHAIPLGRYAGHNAAADLLGLPALEFAPAPYVTCLDLGAAGAVLTTGWDRAVKLTGSTAKDLKRTIVEKRIYPPLDDLEEILNAGDPERAWK